MVANAPQIPSTKARLATSITLKLLNGSIDPQQITVAQLTAAATLGAVVSFSEENTRPADARYEVDADTAGEIVERLPQLVDRTLRLQRTVLYESDMLEAFGISGGDLINQSQPFVIFKTERVPPGAIDANGQAIATRYTIFTGCWFTSNPKAFSVTGRDIKVVQDVTVSYARRQVIVQ